MTALAAPADVAREPLLGVGADGLTRSPAGGYQPAMLALAGVSAASALVVALFVADDRVPIAHMVHPAPHRGCALPDPLEAS